MAQRLQANKRAAAERGELAPAAAGYVHDDGYGSMINGNAHS